jgi:hypothetical protein
MHSRHPVISAHPRIDRTKTPTASERITRTTNRIPERLPATARSHTNPQHNHNENAYQLVSPYPKSPTNDTNNDNPQMLVRKRAPIAARIIPILSLPFQKTHAMTRSRHHDKSQKRNHREDKSDQAASSKFLLSLTTGTVPARAIPRIDELIVRIQPRIMFMVMRQHHNLRFLIRHLSKYFSPK